MPSDPSIHVWFYLQAIDSHAAFSWSACGFELVRLLLPASGQHIIRQGSALYFRSGACN
jgi:hypothetical protein